MSLLVTAAEMRALDRETIESIGVPGVVLMESAGRGVVDVMARHYDLRRARAVVFCGPGNNGGDGYVAARHLAAVGSCLHRTYCRAADRRAAGAMAIPGRLALVNGRPRQDARLSDGGEGTLPPMASLIMCAPQARTPGAQPS